MHIIYLLVFQYVYCAKNNSVDLEDQMSLDNDLTIKYNLNIESEVNTLTFKELTFDKRRTDVKIPTEITEYLVLLIENGIKKINYICRYLQRKLNVKDDLTSIVARLEKDFEMKLNYYVTYAVKDGVECDVDREYLFLDIVSFSNTIMYSEIKKLLNIMVEWNTDNITDVDVQTLTENIYKQHIDYTRQEMNLLCEKVNICRPYPGFSEYFSDLLSEMLKLSDDKLSELVQTFKNQIEERIDFLKSFIKEDIADMVGFKLEALSLDLNNVKELLAVVRSIILQRYKLVKTGEVELKMKTKAVRLLLDIIDRAFNCQTDDLTAITFVTTVKAIRQWQTGVMKDVNLPLRLLVEHVIDILIQNWDYRTREEVLTLTEIMLVGKTDYLLYEVLFAKGSEFVRRPIEAYGRI